MTSSHGTGINKFQIITIIIIIIIIIILIILIIYSLTHPLWKQLNDWTINHNYVSYDSWSSFKHMHDFYIYIYIYIM